MASLSCGEGARRAGEVFSTNNEQPLFRMASLSCGEGARRAGEVFSTN
jgi:hypothetical protein